MLDRLGNASRRGKLAGFHASPPDSPSPFTIEVFGKFINRRLMVEMDPDPASPQSGSILRFENRVRPMPIVIFWGAMILSIWPGVVLTDSLLATYFSWYPRELWVTCAWYLPITILPIPWMWRMFWHQSAAIADAEARLSISKVAAHLGATVIDAP